MSHPETEISHFYRREGLYGKIVAALTEAGIDTRNVSWKDLSAADEFHIRGLEASRELAAKAGIRPGMKILDAGCGIGGASRMLAAEYQCSVTGIDITEEFVETARALSTLTGLDHLTDFVQGNAAALPFPDNHFDIVWTQHVQMNIEAKEDFYSEIHRVLKPGGHFLYYDIFKKGEQPLLYPVPWAADEGQSFLIPVSRLHAILEKTGLKILETEEHTQKAAGFFEAILKKDMPSLSLGLVMGPAAKERFSNLLVNFKNDTLTIESAACIK